MILLFFLTNCKSTQFQQKRGNKTTQKAVYLKNHLFLQQLFMQQEPKKAGTLELLSKSLNKLIQISPPESPSSGLICF
jgi:hypothetical protein